MSIGARLSKLLDLALNTAAVIAGACLLFQVISVTVDVLLRYFLTASVKGVIAFNEWSLLYVTFLGAGWLQRQNGHVRVDILLNLLGRRGTLAADMLGILLGVGICVILVWFGTVVTLQKYTNDIYDFFKLEGVFVWPVYAVIPLGGLLWLLELLRQAYRLIRDERRERISSLSDL